jgi:LPXTG-motif cell wall-anchored protein
VPVAAGVVIALCVHGVKAAARPVVNATTAGVGAPVASTAEDFGSVVLSLLAILLPVLVLLGLALLVLGGWWVIRRRRRRKREQRPVEGVGTRRLFG